MAVAAAGNALRRSVVRAHTELARRIWNQVEAVSWRIKQAAETDPENEDHRMNRLLNQEKYDKAVKGLRAGLHAIELADVHKAASTVPEYKDYSAVRASIAEALSTLQGKHEKALAWNTFPKIRSQDFKLLAAAREVLSDPKLGANRIARMEITYDKQRKTRREGSVSFGAVSADVSVSRYVWDEFAVTTAEKVGDRYYLFSNLFKFFHQGGTDVPVGRWVLGERRKGMRILAGKINS